MDPLLKVAGAVVAAGVVAVAATSIGQRGVPVRAAEGVPAYSQALNAAVARAAAAAGPHAPATGVEAAGLRLRSVGFELPAEGQAFPPGPGAEAMVAVCTACHTPGMILTQPPLTRAEWTGEVNKMRAVYKAPVAEADVPEIVAYLTSLPTHP